MLGGREGPVFVTSNFSAKHKDRRPSGDPSTPLHLKPLMNSLISITRVGVDYTRNELRLSIRIQR